MFTFSLSLARLLSTVSRDEQKVEVESNVCCLPKFRGKKILEANKNPATETPTMIPLTSLFLVKDFTTKKCEEKIIK
jgi:hypothetical protein